MSRTTGAVLLGASRRRGSGGATGPRIKYGTWDNERGQSGVEAALKAAISYSATPYLNMFTRGYTSTHPSSFSSSPVSAAATDWNKGAMLNMKNTDWTAATNGNYDSTWTSFWNSWPTDVWGRVFYNHEPEDDNNAAGAAMYRSATARWYDLSRSIILSRGLNVKIGGLHMLFSYTNASSFRWVNWKWWESITTSLDVATFGLDGYSTTDPGPTPDFDIQSELTFAWGQARTAGFTDFTMGETAADRRQSGHKTDVPIEPWLIGTDQTHADWIAGMVPFWESYPEVSAICHFHSDVGAASQYAQLNGVALTKWAETIRDGKRSW